MKSSFLAFVALAVSGYTQATTYSRTTSLFGQLFLDAFRWYSEADPTHGRVEYVDKPTAEALGLYSVSENSVTLRADHKAVLTPSGPGRKSFRLYSQNQYTEHVAIFDITHMPQACGTWPAIWFYSGHRLLHDGEIDVVEGTNDIGPNTATLHTSANCTMPESRWMTGTAVGDNCDITAPNSTGCGVHFAGSNSFGPEFNSNGGGWYAIERSSRHIAIYFWGRNSLFVPPEVKDSGAHVNPSTWGTPGAYFTNTDCDFATHFGPMRIIINLTFCGDWAGADYPSDGCPSTCVDYVNNNPEAFSNAYFEIRSLNIYE